MTPPRYLIFSDLDGSLLDENYQWTDAEPALKRIRAKGIPLILNSSKTFAELKHLVQELDLDTPMICENGGVIGIPEASPIAQQLTDPSFMGYIMLHPGVNRDFLLETAHRLRKKEAYLFQGFADWSDEEVSQFTGLSLASATQAKRRHATEPILWNDSAARLEQFTSDLQAQGIRLIKGGQFLHIMGQVNKGEAMRLVLHLYQQTFPDIPWRSLALGDSSNDLEMLCSADIAGVIPDLKGNKLTPNATHIVTTEHRGPKGWNEIVETVFKEKIGI